VTCPRLMVPAPRATIASLVRDGLGVWDRIADALAAGHNAAAQIIESPHARLATLMSPTP
jgi:hypothetical protein